MIKEYIIKLSDENDKDLEKLEEQMKGLFHELSCAEEWLESLQIQNNSQKNIFSPRNMDTEIADKIEKASISTQKIKKEIEYVRDLIETHLKKKDEYEKMLTEIDDSDETIKNEKNVDASHGYSKNIKNNIDLKEDTYSSQMNSSIQDNLSKKYVLNILSDLYSKVEICLAFLNSDKNKSKKELSEIKSKIKKYAEEIESK